jgi:uncharacterized membrane protein YGL010W
MKKSQTIIEKRPVDAQLDLYSAFHKKPANRAINYVCIPLILFSILGFVWSVPFPHIGFLGSYNGYLNWASFLIAFAVYYYLKLSPVLSYLMLIVFFGFAYGIIEIIAVQNTGGFVLPQMCLVIFVAANIAQLVGYRIEGNKPTAVESLKFILIEPIWLLSLVLKRYKIRY